MTRGKIESVDQYIAEQQEEWRPALERVRAVIRNGLPEAVETISYGMPTYKAPEGAVLYFAGWKKHYSVYPASAFVVDALREELVPYEVSKGTIRFSYSEPVPVGLIERIARLRWEETARRRSKP